MNKETRENNINNKENSVGRKKFTLDYEAQKKIDEEFSEPQYSRRSRMGEYSGHPQARPTSYGSYGQRGVNSRKTSRSADSLKQKKKNESLRKGKAEGKRLRKMQKQNSQAEDEEFYEDAVSAPAKKKHLLIKISAVITVICLVVIIVNIGIMLFTGKIWFNEPKKRDYPVRGPVITEDMGEIRWNKFPKQNIQLAFIRATKSTTYVDKCFDFNWKQSASTNLPTGALHIFDPDIDGKEQAKHFYETVGKIDGRIVPSVEVKLTGVKKIIHSGYDKITERLVNYVEQIEKYYGVYPIISCDEKTYKKVICNEKLFSRTHKSNFEGCAIWYENLTSKPKDDVKWTFWCYTDRARYSYYDNKNFVRVVLYGGNEDQFKKYIVGGEDDE